jgi:hypothetical protein
MDRAPSPLRSICEICINRFPGNLYILPDIASACEAGQKYTGDKRSCKKFTLTGDIVFYTMATKGDET